jgi:hypothetical protein
VCNTVEEGRLHFGTTIWDKPACQIDVAEFRETVAMLARYREEDTDLHREIHGLQSGKAVAVRRAEEEGYAKGLNEKYEGAMAVFEKEFHKNIAKLLTKQEQGYVMGAFRKALDRD